MMMSKKKAHILAILFDIFSVAGLWAGYNLLNQVFTGIAHSADTVEFNSKVGFFCLGAVFPIVHLVAIYEYYWPKVVAKKIAFFNWSGLILLIILFAGGFFISARVRTYAEDAGYLRCPQVEHQLSFSTGFVYTRDEAICSQLIEEKRKPRGY